MREAKIEAYLVEQIHLLGGTAEKFVSVGKRGVPDRLVCWPLDMVAARFWKTTPAMPHMEFIETKAPGGKLSVPQIRDHAKRRAMGFLVHVIWTKEQANTYLESRGKAFITVNPPGY